MRGSVGLIQQSERHFLLTDSASGVQLVSYEVRYHHTYTQGFIYIGFGDSFSCHNLSNFNDFLIF